MFYLKYTVLVKHIDCEEIDPLRIAPAYDLIEGSSFCLFARYKTGDCVAQNCQCDDESAELGWIKLGPW